MDEVFVKIGGVQHYLWRDVDQDIDRLEWIEIIRLAKNPTTKFVLVHLISLRSSSNILLFWVARDCFFSIAIECASDSTYDENKNVVSSLHATIIEVQPHISPKVNGY